MKVVIFTSSPNADGLTSACGKAAAAGAARNKADVDWIDLHAVCISRCKACDNGWGSCRDQHICTGIEDDFQALHRRIVGADAYVVVTPVYWGGLSESAAAFFDRLRRCEAFKERLEDKQSCFHDIPVVCIAAAGGSGRGTISCLETLERLFTHLGAQIFDMIPITRKTRLYKLTSIEACLHELTK